MYLLLNNKPKVMFFIVSIFILILQINMPSIFIYDNNRINLDLILLFLTFLVFSNGDYKIIYAAFFFGLLQDIIINNEHLGLFSFLKSISVYLLLGIRNYDSIWNARVRSLCILCIFFLHFFIYYFIIHDQIYSMIIFVSLLQSIVCFIIYYLFNRLFFNTK